MYQRNTRIVTVDYHAFFKRLQGYTLTTIHLRIYYTRCLVNNEPDLLYNYAENFIQGLIVYILVHNLPVQYHNIHSDGNNYIFEFHCSTDDQALRSFLKYILIHESIAFCSQIEASIEVLEEPEALKCRLLSYRELIYPTSLFKPPHDELIEQYSAYKLTSTVSLDLLEEYYAFLEEHYTSFYIDVANRACTCWCWREQMADLIIKRHSTNGLIMFPPTFDEAKVLFYLERIVQIVPNTIPENASFPIEVIIDIDIPVEFPYTRVREISEVFTSWLAINGFQFYRRLTGSYFGGQHLLIPIQWKQAYILTGTPNTWEIYSRRAPVHLLSDSIRSAAELLVLAFCKERPQFAKYITTHIFDPHARHNRILFDITLNTLNRGRRALLSMHPSHRGICVAFNNEVLPSKSKELHSHIDFDYLRDHPSVERLTEPPRTTHMIKQNTNLLKELIDRYERVYLQFLTTLPMRFEEQYFDIPTPQIVAETPEKEEN